MVRREPTAEDSFADILARIRLGIAIAEMIKMIATTISNSIREKPFCLLMIYFLWCQNPRGRSARRLPFSLRPFSTKVLPICQLTEANNRNFVSLSRKPIEMQRGVLMWGMGEALRQRAHFRMGNPARPVAAKVTRCFEGG